MTRKELVHRAIDRSGPSRTPINCGDRDFERSDTGTVGWEPAADFAPSKPELSEWGYVWERVDDTMGQPVSHPLADWDRIEDYVPPDACAPGRFASLERSLRDWDDVFVKFGVGISGFNQATFLRGMEAFFVDLYAAPDRANRVLDIVFDFENALIDQAVQYPIDALCWADDWGTQAGLLIQPALWREVFMPRYAEQFDRAHRAGKKVWFHSCGQIHAIIDDLIDIGVDVLELLQPDLLGVERLAKDFGGRVCFCCSVDHQRRAIDGTREEIFEYARFLNDTLGAFNGGFIAYIEDYSSLGMSEQTYQWICEAFEGL